MLSLVKGTLLCVKVYVEVKADQQILHTTMYDREFSYPYIVMYPEFTTVAPHEQLGGVIMGNL